MQFEFGNVTRSRSFKLMFAFIITIGEKKIYRNENIGLEFLDRVFNEYLISFQGRVP